MPAIHNLLTLNTVRVGLSGETKEDLLHQLVDLLEGHPAITDLDTVREAVLERERMMSTGVGKGLGLPHAKTDAVREAVAAFAVVPEGIPFGSIDNEPVRLLFMLVGPESERTAHIKVLSRISRLMNRSAFRERLLDAPDAETVLRVFEETESELLEG